MQNDAQSHTDATDPGLDDAAGDRFPAGSRLRPLAEKAFRDLTRIDQAVYEAIAGTESPSLDEPLRRISNAANRSVMWFAIAGGLAIVRGGGGRRAAIRGAVAIAVNSALVNVVLKSVPDRARPDREAAAVPEARHVRMPSSSSFPSGHSASGFAFAAAVGREIPILAFPLRLLAAAVAYSRVHSGVHYPGDAVAGSLVGAATGQVVAGIMDRARPAS